MNAITLAPSDCEAVPAAIALRTTCTRLSETFDIAKQLGPEAMEGMVWEQDEQGGTYSLVTEFQPDRNGTLRDREGVPQTEPGTITPLGFVELPWDAQSLIFSAQQAVGMAAAAWTTVEREPTTDGRDVVLCIAEDACPVPDVELMHAFGIAEHELQPARDRVAVRLATDPDFTAKFAQARAIMNSACVYFPWYRGDGKIPG